MLWRGSGRWSTYQPHQTVHRFLVLHSFNPRGCLLQSFWRARRESSSASARAFPRRDASSSALRRPKQGHKDERKLAELRQNHERLRMSEQESVRKPPAEVLPIPKRLLLWLQKHFASEPPRKLVCQHINQKQDWLEFLSDAESVCHAAENLAQTSSPRRALYVLQAAHSVGLVYKQSLYERVVFRLAMSEEWNLVLSVVAAALEATAKTTVRLLNWRGRALAEVQDFAKLDGLLGEFAAHGLKPQRRTFMIILQGHLLNHDLARAKATIQDMEEAGFRVTPSTYTIIVPAYRGFGLDNFIQDRGHDVLNSHASRGKEKVLNGLLRLHLDKHDLEGALQLLETFGSQPKAPEPENTIVADGGDHATGAASSPRRRATLADRATYTILINYLLKHGDRTRSLNGILKRMRTGGSPPDIKVGACLVRMYYARGAEHKALVVLCDCCKHHKLQVTVLKSLGYDPRYPGPSVFGPFVGPPTTELLNCVLQGAIKIRGLGATIPVLTLMKRVQVKPDAQTLEVLLWHLAKERLILTEDLVDVMKSLLSYRIRPTLKTLNIIFESIVRSAKLAKHQVGWNALATYAQQAIESLKPLGSKHAPTQRRSERSVPSFDPDLCMTDLQSTVFRDVLRPIIKYLHRRRVLADRATFSLRMRYDSFTLPPVTAAESAARNLQIMRDRGLYPNIYHYTALMEAHCAAGNMRAARDVLQDTISRGLAPQQKSQVIMYTILISANARAGRPDLALSTFKEMLNANISPDVASIDALVGAFFAVKAFRLARRVLLDLWPMVAPFPKELRDAPLGDLMARLRGIRNRAEASQPDVKKPIALNRKELMALTNEITAEWNGVVQAGDEDEQCDDSDNEEITIHPDVGQEVEPQQIDTLRLNNGDKY